MLKYIIFDTNPERIVIFDIITDHSKIVREIGHKVISAGHINNEFNCTNGSVTLDLKYNRAQSENDSKLIKKMSEL